MKAPLCRHRPESRYFCGLTASHLREPFFMTASKKAWHGQAFYYAESPFTFFARFDL